MGFRLSDSVTGVSPPVLEVEGSSFTRQSSVGGASLNIEADCLVVAEGMGESKFGALPSSHRRSLMPPLSFPSPKRHGIWSPSASSAMEHVATVSRGLKVGHCHSATRAALSNVFCEARIQIQIQILAWSRLLIG